METNTEATAAAIESVRETLLPVVEQAERDGVPPAVQAAVLMQFAYAQFQRSDHLDFQFETWVAGQRQQADETQLVEGLLYEIEQADTGRDARLVRDVTEIPRSSGRIPWESDDDRPPETILDSYWKCPHCRETMPTLYELWRAYRNRDRCADYREEYEYGTCEWHAFNEGVHEYRRRIEDLTAGLDHATQKWAREVVEDVF